MVKRGGRRKIGDRISRSLDVCGPWAVRLDLRKQEGGWGVGIEEERGKGKEGGMRTNLSVFWEGIRRHVQNQRFRLV